MKKYAFLFPGQGAQVPGMIKDICEKYPEARKVIDDVSAITGIDMPSLLWESDAETLSRSDNSQLAITTASIAIMKVLETKGIKPSAVMGFSLGEFPALYASGVLSFEDVIKVVYQRGKIMQQTCENIAAASSGNKPGMSAVIGLSPEQVTEITNKIDDVYAANLNSDSITFVFEQGVFFSKKNQLSSNKTGTCNMHLYIKDFDKKGVNLWQNRCQTKKLLCVLQELL